MVSTKLYFEANGFVENKSEPCLLPKRIGDDVFMIGINDDDCLVVGKDEQIKKIIHDLEANIFNLKIERILKDYLSCCVIENVDLKTI